MEENINIITICPLLSNDTTQIACQESQCAWFYASVCAMWQLADKATDGGLNDIRVAIEEIGYKI